MKTNAPMPSGLSPANQCAYQAVSLLYARYRMHSVDRETAQRDKLEIRRTLDAEEKHEQMERKFHAYYSKLVKKIESSARAYRKDRTLENADKLLSAVDGRDVMVYLEDYKDYQNRGG